MSVSEFQTYILPATANNTVLINTAFYRDLPRAFFYRHKSGFEELTGTHAKVATEFAIHQKFKFRVENMVNFSIAEIHGLIEDGYFNWSMRPNTYGDSSANIDYTYPLEHSRYCVIVPTRPRLARFWYVVWPFDRYIWLLIILAIVYAAALMTIQRHPTVSFTRNLLYSFALMHDSPNANINKNNKCARVQIFFLLIFGLGFILSVYYITFLASYFIYPISQPHIDSLDAIIDAGIDVIIPPRTYEILRSGNFSNFHEFEKVMRIVRMNSFMEIINSHHAYILTQEDWDLIDRMQTHLILPKFKYSEICFGDYYTALPLKKDSSFAKNLSDYLLRIKESGLWLHWEDESFYVALKTKLVEFLVDDYPAEPLDMHFFLIAWIVLVGGWTLSALCFIAEILFIKYSKKLH